MFDRNIVTLDDVVARGSVDEDRAAMRREGEDGGRG